MPMDREALFMELDFYMLNEKQVEIWGGNGEKRYMNPANDEFFC